ncbi:MAG: hypothetical protein LBD04_12110 [Synergistaceae bacterium]|jgi:hypothetical protein|nr:hypothetical protein [Synergistaceae bacterium]
MPDNFFNFELQITKNSDNLTAFSGLSLFSEKRDALDLPFTVNFNLAVCGGLPPWYDIW